MSLVACRFPRCRVECEMHSPAYLHKGVTYTVHGILTFIKRLTGLCHEALHHCFVAWTKPSTTALILGTLTDLVRSKSELMAENALLRKPLIILRRQVKRPACTNMDRMLLVVLARAGRDLETSPVHCPARDGSRVGIVRGFSCIGSTNLERLCPNQR